jgi:hypothetical protein
LDVLSTIKLYIMKFIFKYCVLVIVFQYQIIAQNICNDFYTNKKGDIVCFDKDTVYYKIFNNDAFGTYTIGKNKYQINKNGKCYILNTSSIKSQTSILNIIPRKDDSLNITILNSDNHPMEFAYIKITSKKKKSLSTTYISDKDGKLFLEEEQINSLKNLIVSVCVSFVGYTTEKEMELKRGYNYVFKSTISTETPFIFDKTKKKSITHVDSQKIRIYFGKSLKSELYKDNKIDSCSNLLFIK